MKTVPCSAARPRSEQVREYPPRPGWKLTNTALTAIKVPQTLHGESPVMFSNTVILTQIFAQSGSPDDCFGIPHPLHTINSESRFKFTFKSRIQAFK